MQRLQSSALHSAEVIYELTESFRGGIVKVWILHLPSSDLFVEVVVFLKYCRKCFILYNRRIVVGRLGYQETIKDLKKDSMFDKWTFFFNRYTRN